MLTGPREECSRDAPLGSHWGPHLCQAGSTPACRRQLMVTTTSFIFFARASLEQSTQTRCGGWGTVTGTAGIFCAEERPLFPSRPARRADGMRRLRDGGPSPKKRAEPPLPQPSAQCPVWGGAAALPGAGGWAEREGPHARGSPPMAAWELSGRFFAPDRPYLGRDDGPEADADLNCCGSDGR
jgi:hypothetical protein